MRSLRNFSSFLHRKYAYCYGSILIKRNVSSRYYFRNTHNGNKSNLFRIWHHKRSSFYFSTASSSSSGHDTNTNDLPIIITDASVNRLNFLKKKRNETDLMLRIAVSAGGCSGFQYEFEFSDPSDIEQDEDIILKKNEAQFVVDKTSMKFIKGAKLDFVEDFIQTSFVLIDNPNIVSECGCNVSFTPSPDLLEQDDDQ